MTKNFITLSVFAVFFSISSLAVNANIQSPIYKDDIGRMHFMGKGGYSTIRTMQNQEMHSNAVNDGVEKYSKIQDEVISNSKKEVTEIIEEKENSIVPTSAKDEAFSFKNKERKTSERYNYKDYNSYGVNDSKTLYTDELGRLHFFGRDNIIKD